MKLDPEGHLSTEDFLKPPWLGAMKWLQRSLLLPVLLWVEALGGTMGAGYALVLLPMWV